MNFRKLQQNWQGHQSSPSLRGNCWKLLCKTILFGVHVKVVCIPKKDPYQHLLCSSKERKSPTLRVHHPTRLRPAHDVDSVLFFWWLKHPETGGKGVKNRWNWRIWVPKSIGFCKNYQKADLRGSLSLRPQGEQSNIHGPHGYFSGQENRPHL